MAEIQEKEWRGINVKLDEETLAMFEELKEHYRAPTYAHTVRLLVEDAHKQLMNERVKQGVIAK